LAERPHRHDPVLADAACVLGGAALLGSAFVHWVSRGPGRGLRGHEMIDTVVALGRHVPALSAGRLSVLWYLIPALGAGTWLAVGVTGPRSCTTRAVAIAALVVTTLVAAAFVIGLGLAKLALGPFLALAGAVLVVIGAWVPLPGTTRPGAVGPAADRPE